MARFHKDVQVRGELREGGHQHPRGRGARHCPGTHRPRHHPRRPSQEDHEQRYRPTGANVRDVAGLPRVEPPNCNKKFFFRKFGPVLGMDGIRAIFYRWVFLQKTESNLSYRLSNLKFIVAKYMDVFYFVYASEVTNAGRHLKIRILRAIMKNNFLVI